MKIKMNRTISFNALGNIFIYLALLLGVTLMFHVATANFVVAVILFVFAYLAKRKSVFIVLRPFNGVRESIQNTLNLLKLDYTLEDDLFIIDKMGTKIKILKFGFFSLIVFNFLEKQSQSVHYIVSTLVKYQR